MRLSSLEGFMDTSISIEARRNSRGTLRDYATRYKRRLSRTSKCVRYGRSADYDLVSRFPATSTGPGRAPRNLASLIWGSRVTCGDRRRATPSARSVVHCAHARISGDITALFASYHFDRTAENTWRDSISGTVASLPIPRP